MKSNARIGDHPIHPMLVNFPIALFVTGMIFWVVYLAGGGLFWYRAAFWIWLFGVVGALLAAIPGFIDYFTLRMSVGVRVSATAHMLLNLTLVVLFIITLVIINNYRALIGTTAAIWATILAAVGVVLLGISGWIGATVAHLHGISVPEEVAGELGPENRPATGYGQPGISGSKGGSAGSEGEGPKA